MPDQLTDASETNVAQPILGRATAYILSGTAGMTALPAAG